MNQGMYMEMNRGCGVMNKYFLAICIGLVLATTGHASTWKLTDKTAKTTPADADIFGIEDSSSSWAIKKVTLSALKTYATSDIRYIEFDASLTKATDTPSAGTDTLSVTKPVTASKSANYTIGTDNALEAYGGTIFVTSAATITAPAVATGMRFTVVTIGNVAVSLDVNASDRMILDGTALSDGDKATNTSTAGDTIYCQYQSADGFFCWSGTMHATTKHWTDGN